MSHSLNEVKTKSSSWVEKIEAERGSKEQGAGKNR